MLQGRRQDLEAQIRGLREEVEKGQGRLQATHEELLLLRREKREHSLEVTGGGLGGCIWPGQGPLPWGFLGDEARAGSITGSPRSWAKRAWALAQGQVGALEGDRAGVVCL